MCESCGCISCDVCGAPVEDGTCSGCGEKPGSCTCELAEEEFAYDDDEEFEDEDEDLEEDDDEDEEEEEDDEEDEEDEEDDDEYGDDDEDDKDW